MLDQLKDYQLYGSWSKTIRYYNDIIWLTYSIAGIIPLFVLAAYRYVYPLKNFTSYSDKNPFPRTKTTTIQHILTKYPAYYYISDICITLYENRVFDWCRWPFFFHHVISFPLLILMNDRNYLPPIFLIFAAVHALLLAFPHEFWLNFVYVPMIPYIQYIIRQKPYTKMYAFQLTRKVFYLFYMAIAFLGLFDCKNVLPFL